MSIQTADTEERMEEDQYHLVLTGTIIDGHAQGEAVAVLERLLHIPRVKAYSLLQGKRSRIRKVLTKKKADRLRAKLVEDGVGCFIEPVEPEPGPTVSRPPGPGRQEGFSSSMAEPETPGPFPSDGWDPESAPPEGDQQLPSSPQQASLPAGDEGAEVLSLDLAPGDVSSPRKQGETRVMSLELEPLAEAVSREMRDESERNTVRGVEAAGGGEQEPAGGRPDFQGGPSSAATAEDPGHFFEQPSLRRQPVGEEKKVAVSPGNKALAALGGLLLLAAGSWAVMGLLVGGDEAPEAADQGVAETGPPADPQRVETEQRMRYLARSVKVWMIQYGFGFDPHQVTLSRVQGDLQLSQASLEDVWGTPLRYQPEPERYSVLSAGPDRTFGTPDDLKETVRVD